ncbi:MAG: hypothetical protein Q9168_003257 [Polycauliona sp. 1 TL-2023]
MELTPRSHLEWLAEGPHITNLRSNEEETKIRLRGSLESAIYQNLMNVVESQNARYIARCKARQPRYNNNKPKHDHTNAKLLTSQLGFTGRDETNAFIDGLRSHPYWKAYLNESISTKSAAEPEGSDPDLATNEVVSIDRRNKVDAIPELE